MQQNRNDLCQTSIQSNNVCYNTLIDSCGKGRRWTSAISLFQEISKNGLVPNEISRGALIPAAPHWAAALRAIPGCGQVICNAAMSRCEEAGQWRAALQLAWDRDDLDMVGLGALLSALRSSWVKASAALRYGRQMQALTNTISYNSLIHACERGRCWLSALAAAAGAAAAGLRRSIVTFTSAANACEGCGCWELAGQVLTGLCHLSLRSSLISFNSQLQACARGTCWQQASLLLNSCRADATSAATVTKALERKGRWEIMSSLLFAWLPLRHIVPDPICYNGALSALQAASKWRPALQVLASMLGARTAVSESSFGPCLEGSWLRAAALLSVARAAEVVVDALALAFSAAAVEQAAQSRSASGARVLLFDSRRSVSPPHLTLSRWFKPSAYGEKGTAMERG
ncbi:unnamed protein product [Symbiodinium natans]|uniref:Pentatricopeptide repeat-containing protein, chloroplastic n=1 Tax=Symbiodinium natans TaxID=878477 RepID=A0A812LE15_9DINO|nr:unnamed protein product [Symbiodinium natans]